MNGVDQEPSLHYRERSKLIDKAIREARNKASRAIIALDEVSLEGVLPLSDAGSCESKIVLDRRLQECAGPLRQAGTPPHTRNVHPIYTAAPSF